MTLPKLISVGADPLRDSYVSDPFIPYGSRCASKYDRTLLFNAVKKDDFDAIKLLVDIEANVNQIDEIGNTVLAYAVDRSTLDVV